MRDLDQFRSTYFDECAELLTELEEIFAAIAEGASPAERINAAFRAVHSIKGGAGAFGFTRLVAFAHAYETLLGDVRDGQLALSKPVISLCIRADDVLADHVAAARRGEELDDGYGAAEVAQFAMLARGEAQPDQSDVLDLDLVPVMPRAMDVPTEDDLDVFATAPMAIDHGTWEIRFRPHSALYARANDPLLLLRELASLGAIEVTAIVGEIPSLAEFEPFGVYCGWEITLVSQEASEADIRDVFEFVDGICDLSVAEIVALPEIAAPRPQPIQGDRLPRFEEVAAELAMVTPLTRQTPADFGAPAAGASELTAPPEPLPPAQVEPETHGAPVERIFPPEDRPAAVQSIRVDLEKVDRVVNMIGELVITQSMLAQQMDDTMRGRYHELVRGLEVLAQTTRGLQDSVMAIRAQPVRSVFARMPRLIRELSQQTGKPLRLETAGETTEIDKTVVEQLADPLVHMIRNAADHGIEPPEQRRARGKPETGTIRLSAEQAGSFIVVSVEDDGAGIDRPRVLDAARRRGVIGADAVAGDEQIDSLIFAPGLSTAEAVSDLSGRGVGLDVVMSNIKKLGGSVQVRSFPGRGTRISLRLPLTLAVVDVMQVTVAGSPYVVPLSAIVETIQSARASFSRGPSGAPLLRVRGEYVQVIDLAERFGMTRPDGASGRFVVLCEVEGTTRLALVVDDIVGQQQVVIKSLEQNFEPIEGIAGGTILGDGRVALILDVDGLKSPLEQRRAA